MMRDELTSCVKNVRTPMVGKMTDPSFEAN
jgi:hypothetical protein